MASGQLICPIKGAGLANSSFVIRQHRYRDTIFTTPPACKQNFVHPKHTKHKTHVIINNILGFKNKERAPSVMRYGVWCNG